MILCMMRIPPHPEGHGGNQRAWFLINALRRIDTVHLALVYPATDSAAAAVSLDPARGIVSGITVFPCNDWGASAERWPGLPWAAGLWIDRVAIGSVDAARLSRRTLRALAKVLPAHDFDTVFAARSSIAVIVDDLLGRGLIRARRRVVDIDDIMSQFRRRQRDAEAPPKPGILPALLRANWRAAQTSEIAALERVEARLAATWDAVALCSDDDIAHLRRRIPSAALVRVPNVVERPLLSPHPGQGAGLRLLFVGNLLFAPNSHGLARFLAEAWPQIQAQRPDAELTVVGLSPPPALRAMLAGPGITLHANVATVEPFYAAADIVIAPIFFGGGTRIKILEAMAFGRPVVSTTIGVEGLGLTHGEDVMIADSMADFATDVLQLAGDEALRHDIAHRARQAQRDRFSVDALNRSIAELITKISSGDARGRTDIDCNAS